MMRASQVGNRTRGSLVGWAAALGSGAAFGLVAPLDAWLLARTGPGEVVVLANLFAALVILVVWNRRVLGPLPRARGWRVRVLVGSVVGVALAPLLLILALERISPPTGALLVGLEVVWATLLAWILLQERLGRLEMAGGLLILIGVGILFLPQVSLGGVIGLGGLLAVGAGLLWAIDSILMTPISQGNLPRIVMIKGLVGGILGSFLVIFITGSFRLPAYDLWPVILVLGVITIVVAMILFYVGLRHLGAARATFMMGTAPLWAMLYTVVGGGRVTGVEILAGVVMIAGIALLTGWLIRRPTPIAPTR